LGQLREQFSQTPASPPSTLHSYWVSAYDAASNFSTTSTAVSAFSNFGPDQYGTTWKPLRIGAGGFITGIDIASNRRRLGMIAFSGGHAQGRFIYSVSSTGE
jgi:hypothetical protein